MRDILSTKEAAKLAGISPASLRTYRTRKTFPQPDGYLANVPWWYRATVEAWMVSKRPRGRPRKTT